MDTNGSDNRVILANMTEDLLILAIGQWEAGTGMRLNSEPQVSQLSGRQYCYCANEYDTGIKLLF